ncbi:MAG: hypothetical protein COZ29_02570 [Candidatus Moranbacteria bacterium CG_4_10_14_3_um_filter_45_9]|nr:MAG: hypothetical protein COZ29_02570 [Candidatus Moranbacteria bacterium CG_4_10_14_3_um_filter_45_9]
MGHCEGAYHAGTRVLKMHQPRFFADFAFFAFFPLAGGPLGPSVSGDIFSALCGVLRAGKFAGKHHNSRPAPASSYDRYKKSWHTADTKQPSVK